MTVPWGCTGTLDGLVGSHTRLAIYPALAICYWRVVIHALLNTRFKVEVGSDLPSYCQTTKVTLTEEFPRNVWVYAYGQRSHTFYSGYAPLHKRHSRQPKYRVCGSSTDPNTLY